MSTLPTEPHAHPGTLIQTFRAPGQWGGVQGAAGPAWGSQAPFLLWQFRPACLYFLGPFRICKLCPLGRNSHGLFDLGNNHVLLGRHGDYIDKLPRLRASSWKGCTGSPGSLSLVRKPSVSPLSWKDRTCFFAVSPLTQPPTQCSS